MCIGVWALEHPDYALILCENRDEFLDRPTQNAHWHSFEEDLAAVGDKQGNILSGRDERAGGSWFGLNKAGRVALLTNITEPASQYESSRGYLISSFLLSNSSHPLEDELGKIVLPGAVFAGFNLLLLAPTLRRPDTSVSYDALFVTNHGGGGVLTSRQLTLQEKHCGCVSNGVDGEGANDWPKVKHATEDLSAVLQTLSQDTTDTELAERLFEILAWRCSGPLKHCSELRNTVQVEPMSILLEGSPITTPAPYGTRISTVLLVRRNGDVCFIERDIWKRDQEGQVVKVDPPTQREFRFKLDVSGLTTSGAAS